LPAHGTLLVAVSESMRNLGRPGRMCRDRDTRTPLHPPQIRSAGNRRVCGHRGRHRRACWMGWSVDTNVPTGDPPGNRGGLEARGPVSRSWVRDRGRLRLGQLWVRAAGSGQDREHLRTPQCGLRCGHATAGLHPRAGNNPSRRRRPSPHDVARPDRVARSLNRHQRISQVPTVSRSPAFWVAIPGGSRVA
jgi:hypothetical protein